MPSMVNGGILSLVDGRLQLVMIDSDNFLVKPFDPRTLSEGERTPFYREVYPDYQSTLGKKWHQTFEKILRLKQESNSDRIYVGNFIFWRRDNLIALQKHLETSKFWTWQTKVCRYLNFSEYTLYGVFCDDVLAEKANLNGTDKIFTLSYWKEKPMTVKELIEFGEKLEPHQFAISISAKSKTPTQNIIEAFNLTP